MQEKKYETTGKARKMIGDAAWYVSLIVFLMVIFVVASSDRTDAGRDGGP